MGSENSTFQVICPSRFTTFTFPNPSSASLLRVAVLDSPLQLKHDPPRVAAMLVPHHRHSDWIFSTNSGHLQLLLATLGPPISRLILIGPTNDMSSEQQLGLGVSCLKPLLLALSPKSCFKNGIPDIPILSYQDNVVSLWVLEKCVGPLVGEMVVEDVELQVSKTIREFRRRLRFKRMPNLVQTEMRLLGSAGQVVDGGVLVHPYLVSMVASLSLAAPYIEGLVRSGLRRPKALCLGVGGGALLGFLRAQLGFHVVGVEADEEVLRVARQYFGLEEDGEHIKVYVRDAMEIIEKLADQGNQQNLDGCDASNVDTRCDVIMVDLDASDAWDGVIAPPLDFVRKHVLLSARSILSENGILAINVIPPNISFYKTLVHEFREVFSQLYEIDVGNGENFVLIATATPLISSGDFENCFLSKLSIAISGAYLNTIKKI